MPSSYMIIDGSNLLHSAVRDRVRMYGDMCETYFMKRSIFLVHGYLLHGIQCVHAVDDSPKNCILSFQMGLLRIGYEKL